MDRCFFSGFAADAAAATMLTRAQRGELALTRWCQHAVDEDTESSTPRDVRADDNVDLYAAMECVCVLLVGGLFCGCLWERVETLNGRQNEQYSTR